MDQTGSRITTKRNPSDVYRAIRPWRALRARSCLVTIVSRRAAKGGDQQDRSDRDGELEQKLNRSQSAQCEVGHRGAEESTPGQVK